MFLSIIWLLLGFSGLYFGALWLVGGASQLARSTGIRPVIIALTIVAFGTSAPEFVVSLNAAIHNTTDIAVGNIIGSMIANIGLILGISAVVKPIQIEFRLLKKELPILIGCELVFIFMCWNLLISRIDGIILLIMFVIFNWYCVREGIRNIKEKKSVTKEYDSYIEKKSRSKFINILMILLGIGCLVGASQLVIVGVVDIALYFGISAFIISASLIAFGTSLPELATSVIAAARGEFDISVGNVLGSNIFNILLCIGTAALFTPLAISKDILRYDISFMLGLTVLLGIFMFTKKRISRIEGVVLIAIYGGYLVYLFI